MLNELRALFRVGGRTLFGAVFARREPGATLAQMYEIGNRSALFIALTLGFLGMVLVFQTCLQVNHIIGDLSLVGAEFIKILVHEFAPSLGAMMIATRVGAGIAAEIGSMVVTEQVDALRMSNVDPIDFLLVPRLKASVVMTLVLACIGVLSAVIFGTLTARYSFHVNPHIFLDTSRTTIGDLATGVIKCIAFGTAIPIVSGYCGLAAKGGSEGVGEATTRAVIYSLFSVILLDFILSGIALFTLQRTA
jgi:phospholipid/cholesterol/gamma-HCH transport system permease protein